MRAWSRPATLRVRLQLEPAWSEAETADVKAAIGENLAVRVLGLEVDAEWLELQVETEDALSLQWGLVNALGPFAIPGFTVVSCQVWAKYRVLVKGDADAFRSGTFAMDCNGRTGVPCQVIKSTPVSATWTEIFMTAELSEPEGIHKFIVDLESSTLSGYEAADVALATPLECTLNQLN